MNLIIGLDRYYKESNYMSFANQLELDGLEIIALLNKYRNNPNNEVLEKAKKFLIDIEKWKADCLQQRMGNAVQNDKKIIWKSLFEAKVAYDSKDDIQVIRSIMSLKGFGSSVDDETGQRRAKVATAVLRFLWPIDYGVVDWRNAAIIGFLEKNNWNFDLSINEAKKSSAKEFRQLFDIIDEKGAIAYNEIYRKKRNDDLKRASDIDMALFGLSLLVWPFKL